MAELRNVDPDGRLIASGSYKREGRCARLVVTNTWHYRPYQLRLQTAQSIWGMWALIHSPHDRDRARIKLVDYMGNEVGGSRLFGGSLIWVQKD